MSEESLSSKELESLLEGAEIVSDDTGKYKKSDREKNYELPTEENSNLLDQETSINKLSASEEKESKSNTKDNSDKVIVGQFSSQQKHNVELLLDIYVKITVELGRTNIKVKDVLGLGEGSIIELNKPANEPVDLLVNNRLVARGEVVVIDENFGTRVSNIASPNDWLILEDT